MRIPLVLTTLLLLSTTLAFAAPASADPDPCWQDPITQQSPCSVDCTGGSLDCKIIGILLFPCEQPWAHC